MKRIISMLLALVMVFGLFPVGAAAEETATAQHIDHCVCGGTLTGVAAKAHEAECTVVQGWTAITAENFVVDGLLVNSTTSGRVNFASNGHYYLAEDVSTASVIELLKGADITICLNGHTLTSATTGNSAVVTSGNLTICDCAGGGKITAKSTKAAGMIKMVTSTADAAGTTFNLYGGTLEMTDNNYTANAGVIQVGNSGSNPGVFNMYGGTVTGGTANKGGNILIGTAAATVNMYGGSVTNGAVKTNDSSVDRNRGGNFYVNKGTLNVYGGTVSGGITAAEDKNPQLGGDIFQIGGTVYLDTAFGALDYANDGTGCLTLGENFAAQKVTCASAATGTVQLTGTATAEQAAAFTVSNGGHTVGTAYTDGCVYLTEEVTHCVCGGKLNGVGGHVCETVTWEAWDGTTDLESGHNYYLTDTDGDGVVTLSTTKTITANQQISLCLNGLELTSEARALLVHGGANTTKLNICDCHEKEQWGSVTSTASVLAPVLHSYTNNRGPVEINLFGGHLQAKDNAVLTSNTSGDVGAVRLGNNTTAPKEGVFNMYDGTISGGVSAEKAGNLWVSSGCTFNMYGGSIYGGSTVNYGHNIYLQGAVNLLGGSVIGNATQTSDSIYVDGTLNVGGAVQITGASSNVYLPEGKTMGINELADTAKIGVTVAHSDAFATTTDGNDAGCFTSDNQDLKVAYANGELKLVSASTKLTLRYDDRKPLADLVGSATEVSISDQVVTSKKTGTEDSDDNVLVYTDGVLYATGVGTATLTVDGTDFAVTVEAAPISLFMITGHSIGRGEKGDAAQSVAVEAGQAYNTHRYHTYSATESAAIIDPNEVTDTTGLGYAAANRLTGIDQFAAGQGGNEGEGAALAWQWNQLTGEKVWVINAAVGGSCINEWIPGAAGHNTTYTYHYDTSVTAFKNAQAILENEVAAGHYTLSHTAIIYHSAANFSHFADWTQELIEDYYDQMWNGYKTELGVEVMGLVPIWTVAGRNTYSYDKAANFYMAASSEYEDVFMASLITRNWMTAAGLASFPDITYITQSTAVSKPTSVHHKDQGGSSTNSVFCSADTTHLSQVTYNAQGIDIANNMYAYWNGDKTVSSVELRNSINGLLDDTLELAVGENTYAVPVVDTVYANNLTINVEGDITVKFPMQIVAEKEGVSTITISQGDKVFKTLTVTVTPAHSHCVCGGHVDGHACEDVTWTPWGDDYSEYYALPTTAGYYYLTKDITISNEYNIGENSEIFLCLNGHNITNTKTDKRVYNIYGKLNIADCSAEENWGTISGSRCDADATVNTIAGTFQLRDNKANKTATVNLYSGIITSNNPYVLTKGGVVQLGNTGQYGSVFNMYGGKLTGGYAVNGGTVNILKNSIFNLYGGEVSGGEATENGGIFYIAAENAQLNISGGTVTGGVANTDTGLGGNIYQSGGTVTITGGKIINGNAKLGGSMAIAGSCSIANAEVSSSKGSRGRAIYVVNGGEVTIKDSTILNNSTAGTAIWNCGQLNLQGTVNMPAYDETKVTMDMMLDCQNGTASIDISGLTGQDAPFGIRRWELDETDDDPGLIATGATQEQLTTAFFAWRVGYTLSYADGSIYLVQQSVYGMGSDGKLVQGYDSVSQAIEAANENVTYLKLQADLADQVVSRDVLIDLNGHKLTNLTIAEGVVLTGMDSTTNDYDCTDGYGLITLSEESLGSIASNVKTTTDQIGSIKRYLTITTDEGISFHRFYMGITHISLKPATAAFGYKAAFYGDEMVTKVVTSYGYDIWVNDGNAVKQTKNGAFTSGQVLTLRVQNIMVDGNDQLCQLGSTATVNGNVFITFDLGGEQLSLTSSDYSCNMQTMLETINGQTESFSAEQMQALQSFCQTFADYMTGWEIGNILN